MPRTVFYAWQSDLPNSTNRAFIRRALDSALVQINADLEPSDAARADQDTQGLAGSPPVAEAIFQKIDDCAVFVADITTVVGAGTPRPMPNPNVLIEYGRASKKGDQCLIQIFNEAFGNWQAERPFDLRHKRGPICYRLSEEATPEERKRVLESLSKELAFALKLSLDAAPQPTAIIPSWSQFDRFRKDYSDLTIDEWAGGRRLPGFWCAAIPLESVDLGRVSERRELLTQRTMLRVTPGRNWETVDDAGNRATDRTNIFQGGIRVTSKLRFESLRHQGPQRAFEYAAGCVGLRKDGSICIGAKWSDVSAGPSFNISWIIADIANLLRSVAKIRIEAHKQNLSYALVAELRYDETIGTTISPVKDGEWRLCYPFDNGGTLGALVTSDPIQLGPYILGSTDSFHRLLVDILKDIYEAAGRSPDQNYTFDLVGLT